MLGARRGARLAVALLSVGLGLLFAGAAQAATPPFNQCPAIGADTSCGILLTINADGSITVDQDPTQGPFDAIEDTLIGVQNNSTQTIPTLHLTSSVTAGDLPFGFDGDGICFGFYAGTPAGCPFGTTGYEGPNTSFSNISLDLLSGDVNFTGGLAAGASAYFSLEGAINADDLHFNSPPVCSAATTNLKTLWPPNHQLVPVTISGVTDPNGDAVTINITGVTQDEPTNGLGDGDTGPADAVITASSATVRLRAERSGKGDGRVYVVSFTGTDPSGANCSGALRVTVQHDQKPGNVAIDSGQFFNSAP